MASDYEGLAALIHEECCGDATPCARWNSPSSGHRGYYQDRAESIMIQLAPVIGAANVPTACRVILAEMD
jgi:hypothetical protein